MLKGRIRNRVLQRARISDGTNECAITTSHGGNRLGWDLKSDDVIWKAIRMEWRLPTTVRVF